MKGDMFGESDLKPIAELVEQYDHLMEKQSRIIDYYASPNLMVKGVSKSQIEISKGERTMFFLPENGDIKFIEWTGAPQGIEEHIKMVREAISEISETPQIAFGKTETGMSNVSGIDLKILYGPLVSKTERKRQKSWGPQLERAMQIALLAENIEVELDKLSINWMSPLPENEVEEWQIGAEKAAMGVSKKQVMRENGYTEDEIEKFAEEKSEEADIMAEEAAKQFAAGKVPGSPYKDPKQAGSTDAER